jgi:hypothetical protein
VSKLDFFCLLDHVGRNHVAFSTLQSEFETVYHQPWSPLPGLYFLREPIEEEASALIRFVMDARLEGGITVHQIELAQ